MTVHNSSGLLGKGLRGVAAALALVFAASACDIDEVLTVGDPAVATPESLENPAALPTLVSGAIGDFQAAYSGNGLADAFNAVTATITDEWRSSDTFTDRNDADRRTQADPAQGNRGDIPYTALQRSRRSAEAAAGAIRNVGQASDSTNLSLVLSLAGLSYVALGEGFCSAIPFKAGFTADPTPGPMFTTAQVFDTSIVRFDAALAALGGTSGAVSTNRRNLAQVGRGRALLNKGSFQEAAAAVAGVPTSFVFFNEHSANSGRQENSVWNLNGSNRRFTLSDREGGNGLNFRSANDPRIPYRDQGRNGFDNATRLFEQLRYDNRDADVPVADGIEARLIEAEAALARGDIATYLTTLNTLRASVRALMTARYQNYTTNAPADGPFGATSLPALTDPGTAAGRVDLLFRERAFWLYLTGHRLGDVRRLIRQYGRAASTVFPVGPWHKGGVYGEDVNLLIPFNERNNPNFDPAACVRTQA